MAAYPLREDTVQLLKDTVNIVEIIGQHVTLKKVGSNLKGLCPFHSEKTPSFIVNPERRSFHCFGCGEGGDVFSFMMKYHRLSFPDVLKELARQYNISLPEKNLSPAEKEKIAKRDRLYKINEKAAQLFHKTLLDESRAEEARHYLSTRGLSAETVNTFRIGYAPESWDFLTKKLSSLFHINDIQEAGLIIPKDRGGSYDRFRNRIIFPITAANGRIVGFGGRILGDGQPKYMNSPETPIFDKSRTLYGLFENKDIIRKKNSCYIVEGNFDLLSMVTHGVRNVVAPLGTALSTSHLRILKGYSTEITLLFDGDEAGLKAAMRAVPLFLTEQISAQIVILPEGDDPDTYLQNNGKENFIQLLQTAVSLPEFVFDSLVKQYGMSLEGKNKIIEELKPILKALDHDSTKKALFVSHFSEKLGITSDQMLSGIAQTSVSPSSSKEGQARHKEINMPLKQRQIIEFLISYPKYFQEFMEAGLETVIDDHYGKEIIGRIKNLSLDTNDTAPEQLLENTNDILRSFLSRLLVSAPAYPDDKEKARADEMVAWLKQSSLRAKKKKLTRRINEAQSSRDIALCLKLMEEKKEIDKALSL